MKRVRITGIGILIVALSWGFVWLASVSAATEQPVRQYEGQIKSIKVDKCGLQPGSCEGSIILAKTGGGEEVTLAIKPGTWLKRGDLFVTIDELGVGNYVKVEAIQLPGQQLQEITVLNSSRE